MRGRKSVQTERNSWYTSETTTRSEYRNLEIIQWILTSINQLAAVQYLDILIVP